MSAIVYVFCFWFSLRLGAIIIGALTLIQASLLLMVTLVSLDNIPYVRLTVQHDLEILKINPEIVQKMHVTDELKAYLIAFATFYTLLILSCIQLIYGALQCKLKFLYCFVICYAIYLFLLLGALVLLMLYLKGKNYGLGDLILYANLGGFVFLFYLYTWVCVWSLCQVITELQMRLNKKEINNVKLPGKRPEVMYKNNYKM